MQKRVLILCTGNSCRSQMAELIWRDIGGEKWQTYSAGSDPTGYVHPRAIDVLNELGLETAGLKSKSLAQFCVTQIDLVVSVCDNAKESCPAFVGEDSEHLHWPFEDPAHFEGSDDQVLQKFREVRDQIKEKISHYLQSTSAESA